MDETIRRKIQELLDGASSAAISSAFWHACAGGQRRAAELLLANGADLNWVPPYAKGTPLDQATDLRTLMPQTRLTLLPGVGHIPQIEDPDAFNAALLSTIKTF